MNYLNDKLPSKFKNSFSGQSIALYIHIPFCEHLCHYCDFAKTANFGSSQVENYFSYLEESFDAWHDFLGKPKFQSIFVGGGTPSLFVNEYEPLMQKLRPYFTNDAEITIETNPKHINTKALVGWQQLGFNRLSLGIQTFDDTGLKELTRKHDSLLAEQSLSLSKSVFENVSVDLIYAWPRQTTEQLQLDLLKIAKLQPQHISAYALIYEPNTPMHRRLLRGVVDEVSDKLQYDFYQMIQSSLAASGYCQYELSNWSKPGFESRHNQTYWKMETYLALGIGSHGFLKPTAKDIGLRYSYPKSISLKSLNTLNTIDIEIEERHPKDYFQEAVLSGLRYKKGVRLDSLAQCYLPSSILEGLQKPFQYHEGRLTLDQKEWFRENYWIRKLFDLANI